MVDFFRNFFGYYRYIGIDGELGIPESYKDELGGGAFSDWRHFAWMIVIVLLGISLYQLFKRHHKAGEKTVFILAIMMFIIRLGNQIARAIIGAEYPAWRAFPFHMCTVLSFLLPLIVVFKWNRLKPAAYTIGIMGGIVTVLLSEYFDNRFLPFATIEGMWMHSLLILIPIIEIATNHFKIEFKNTWMVFVGMGLLIGWASIANNVFFKEYRPNYMYLQDNGLPGHLGAQYYFFIYIFLFILLFLLIYSIPTFYRMSRKSRN